MDFILPFWHNDAENERRGADHPITKDIHVFSFVFLVTWWFRQRFLSG